MAGVRLNSQKVAEIKEAFMLFDYDKDGRIFTRDVGPVIRSVGLKPSDAEVKDIMATVNESGGEVDLESLIKLISQRVTDPPSEQTGSLREMFRMYDREGKGLIEVGEMRHLLTTIGEKLSEEEAEELLKMTGCVQGGMVQYDKLIQMVMRG